MPFDLSRQIYCHSTCNTLPCSCVRVHKPLEVLQFPCTQLYCNFLGQTINQLQEHNLDKHSAQLQSITTNGEYHAKVD